MKRLLSLLIALLSVFAAGAQVVINEVMAANLGECMDPSWNFGGWIELYNPSKRAYDLKNCTLTDHKGRAYRLTSAHGSVPAGGFCCVWFGHNDTAFPTQVDFKLDCEGGTITIVSADGGVVDAVTYPAVISRTSWARIADGADAWGTCAPATPGQTNALSHFAAERLAPPECDHTGGWIEGPLTFSVIVGSGAALHYTTDGTVPTTSSPRAATDAEGRAQFSVSKNAVYRFRAFADDALPSAVVTRSFITRSFTKTVIDDDWGWGGWGNWTHEETTTFPATDGFSLLSVVTDPDFLYDDKIGIYVEGTNGGWSYWTYANYYRDWDRPVNVEIFDAEGLPLVNQEADMAISGGYSRMSTPKSFKLKSDRKFEGVNYYPLTGVFEEKPFVRYKDVLVRVGGTGMVDRHQDNALQALVRRSGFYIDTQAYRPVYVFLNGQYEETLFMREPSNKQYGYSNYGMDTDEMDTLEESDITGVTLTNGTWDAFGELYDAAVDAKNSDAKWQRVCELLDIDEFANYFALELFLANQDWPQNNIKMFRDQNDGRFHVVLQDLDACFHETGNTFQRLDQSEYYNYATAGRQENILLTPFLRLLEREEFRRRFVDAFCIVAGSVLSPDVVGDGLSQLSSALLPGYVEQYSSANNAFNTLRGQLSSSWQQKRLDYLRRWSRLGLSSSRGITATINCEGLGTDAASTAMKGTTLLLNGQPIPRGRFSGTLFLPVTLEAHVPVGKKFVGWKSGSNIVSTEPLLQLTAEGHYTAVYAPVDEDVMPAVVVNEVSAANAIYQSERLKRSDWIELYNTTDTPVDIEGMYISDDATTPCKYQIAETCVIPAHGHLVLWADDSMPADASHVAGRPYERLHLPFKLANRDNQCVTLTSADGTWHDTLFYHAMKANESVGRWPDASESVYRFEHPTIEESNLLTSNAQLLVFDPIIVGVTAGAAPHSTPSAAYDLQGRKAISTSPSVIISDGRKALR